MHTHVVEKNGDDDPETVAMLLVIEKALRMNNMQPITVTREEAHEWLTTNVAIRLYGSHIIASLHDEEQTPFGGMEGTA